MSVAEGDRAPEFSMTTDGGGSVDLASLKGKPVILYFYPRDDTPGCTKEACGFRDSFPDFTGADAVIIPKDRQAPITETVIREARQVQNEVRPALHTGVR